MSYTAKIFSKIIERDQLKVVVEFTNSDDNSSFKDSFTTNQTQGSDWIDNAIKAKLKHLNGIKTLIEDIEINKVVTEEVVPQSAPPVGTKAAYKKDLDDLQKMINAISRGVMLKTNPDFLALKQKLKDNFSIDYIDLF